MKDIDIFKKIKKYSKLSLIFTILIFIISIISFTIIPTIIYSIGQNNPSNRPENNEIVDIIFVSLLTISAILIFIFTILIFIYNILTIVKTCSLNESKDKTLLIVMAVLSLVWLGIISNIIILVVSNSNIKKILSENEQTVASSKINEKSIQETNSVNN